MKSMTGFATVEAGAEGGDGPSWRWDAKSVNGRGLDVKLRTPAGWERQEALWRAAIAERFARGSLSVTLSWSDAAAEGRPTLNAAALDRAAAWAAAADRALARQGAPRRGVAPEALLQLRGVVETTGPERRAEREEAEIAAVAASLARALDQLAEARAAEGARLAEIMARVLSEIEALTDAAARLAEARAPSVKARLAERVAALLEAGAPPIEEGRLAQELALLATKLDVTEEIDRLRAHIAQARALMAEGAPVGRKLDFLCQEFNREANTLCAKSQDPALTETGLALKVAIDQLKEQAANVE
ncbi:MAG: YicC/YloC family endoribonuclease [Pseudomonadota bacterium]